MKISYRPIEEWPREMTKYRKRSPFKADYTSTMKLLERELRIIRVSDVIVQLALMPNQFRLDGMPYANTTPSHPGVIVSFTKGKEPLAFPCDAFLTWVENTRAVALALEALRKVDRYGVTKHAEQYRGWSALPPAIVTPGVTMTLEDAARLVTRESGIAAGDLEPLKDSGVFKDRYRVAARRLHADANGGEVKPEWHRLQVAADLLQKHHGI